MFKIILKSIYNLISKRDTEEGRKSTLCYNFGIIFGGTLAIFTIPLYELIFMKNPDIYLHPICCMIFMVSINYYYVYISGSFMLVRVKFYHYIFSYFMAMILPIYGNYKLDSYFREKYPERMPPKIVYQEKENKK